MLNSALRPRVSAVSYLNTVPLIWGLQHGRQSGVLDLEFCLPSECADRLHDGKADLGLIPVIEMARQGLDFCPGTGIACDGDVRSILLISKRSSSEIRTLAVDVGSRSSVMLARIILSKAFGSHPELRVAAPDLESMLASNDAALVIGDPALHLNPATLPYETLDLGREWKKLTGLPMVFAMWSGKSSYTTEANSRLFQESLRFGEMEMDRIVALESGRRGLPDNLVHRYLTSHIRYHLGEREYEGLRTYLRFAANIEPSIDVTAGLEAHA